MNTSASYNDGVPPVSPLSIARTGSILNSRRNSSTFCRSIPRPVTLRQQRRRDSPYPIRSLSRETFQVSSRQEIDFNAPTPFYDVESLASPPRIARSRQTVRSSSPRSDSIPRSVHVRQPEQRRRDSPHLVSASSALSMSSSYEDSDNEHVTTSSIYRSIPRDEWEMKMTRDRSNLFVTQDRDFVVDDKCIIGPCMSSQSEHNHVSVVNTCPICQADLCSSANKPIGATVPCGHMFHVDCFRKYMDHNRISRFCSPRHLNTCKCPTCSTKLTNFVRLYLTCEEIEVTDDNDAMTPKNRNDIDSEMYKMKATIDQLKKQHEQLSKENEAMKRVKASDPMKEIGKVLSTAKDFIDYVIFNISRGCRRADIDHDSYGAISSVLSFDDGYDLNISDEISVSTSEITENDEERYLQPS